MRFDKLADDTYNGNIPEVIVETVRGLEKDGTETYFRGKERRNTGKEKEATLATAKERTSEKSVAKEKEQTNIGNTTQQGGISLPENRNRYDLKDEAPEEGTTSSVFAVVG